MTTLSVNEVATITNVTVTDADIASAAWLIDNDTGWTPAEHVSKRELLEAIVKQAWAIVASRVAVATANVGAEAVTAETQGDYQFTTDVGVAEKYQADLLAGLPRQLLGEEIGFTVQMRSGQRVISNVSSASTWWL